MLRLLAKSSGGVETGVRTWISGSGMAAGRLLYRSVSNLSRVQHIRPQTRKPSVRSFTAGSRSTIGISEYAAKALGDVVYVELPTVDTDVAQGDSIGAVESVKSASDIMTPVSGVIQEVNNTLETKPATINGSPEADGWLAKIKVSKPEELESLMDDEGYRKFTEDADAK
nr:putative glycine cleavage system h protein, mitochondrial [Quercus suber]